MLNILVFVAGLFGVGYLLNDVFQGVVVPRPTPGRFRLSRWLIRPTWRAWRACSERSARSPSFCS
jgi:hypothetical protein